MSSEAADYVALYRHLGKLDKVCRQAGLKRFREICDHTDYRFNIEDQELPEGMEPTDELMALDGVWMDAAEARDWLSELLAVIQQRQPRFGLLSNDHEAVVDELSAVIAFATIAANDGAHFNLAVVM